MNDLRLALTDFSR